MKNRERNRERNRQVLYWVGAGLSWLAVLLVLAGDSLGLELPRLVGGLLAGGGGALGGLLTVKALFARHYRRNEKARRAAEREEKDERNQMLRGIAAYRSLLAATPIFIVQWVILLVMDAPMAVLVVVMLAYLAHFVIYMYQLVRLQREL